MTNGGGVKPTRRPGFILFILNGTRETEQGSVLPTRCLVSLNSTETERDDVETHMSSRSTFLFYECPRKQTRQQEFFLLPRFFLRATPTERDGGKSNPRLV